MEKIGVQVIYSSRKTIGIQIKDGSSVILRVPRGTSERTVQECLDKNREWICRHLQKARAAEQEKALLDRLTGKELEELGQRALQVLPEKLRQFAPRVGVRYGRVTIRCQKTRWGSCSAQGNLNFNCLLMLCPENVIDYVVVHELCHRLEMNHSARFWQLVERILPDYKKPRKWLKTEGRKIIGRVY